MTGELGLHRFDQVLIRVAVLQATRFRDGQQTLQEAATRRTLSSEAQLAVDHRRTESPLGRVVGRFNLRGNAAARAVAAMKLVFVDDRLDLGQFPHLMTPRRRGIGLKFAAASSARAGVVGSNRRAILGGHQVSLMPLVSLLTALLPLLPRLLFPFRLGVRMFGARRERRVARREPRIARRELLKLLGQRLHLLFEFVNSLFVSCNECFNEVTSRFGFRRTNKGSGLNGTAGLVARGYVMRRLRVRPGAGVLVFSSGPTPSVCVC